MYLLMILFFPSKVLDVDWDHFEKSYLAFLRDLDNPEFLFDNFLWTLVFASNLKPSAILASQEFGLASFLPINENNSSN